MNIEEFFHHTEGLRQAITTAIGAYLSEHRIDFCEASLVNEAGGEIEELSKSALFYGAEVFPDAPH